MASSSPIERPRPGLIELKKVIEPVKVSAISLSATGAKLSILNRHDFVSLDHLSTSWKVEADGKWVAGGSIPTPQVPAGKTAEVEILLNLPAPVAGAEYVLTISFSLSADSRWATVGHEIAWAQFKLPIETPIKPVVDKSPVRFLRAASSISAMGNNFELAFDTVRGLIRSWDHEGSPVLLGGPRLNLWRAPTDNDRIDFHSGKADKAWREAFIHLLQHRTESVEISGNTITIKSVIAAPNRFSSLRATYVYTVQGSGDIWIETTGEFHGSWPQAIPRIGLQLTVPGDYIKARLAGPRPW